jgi:hypothetical protein
MLEPTPQRVFCAVFLGLLILLVAAWGSGLQGEICEQSKTAGQEYCSTYGAAFFLVIKLGNLLDNHAGAIAAFATIAIAAFTWTLWRSTDKLWDANERQLRHAVVESQRARVYRLKDEDRIREQIKISRDSANAALLNAEALINSERARLYAVVERSNLYDTVGFAGLIDQKMDDEFVSTRPSLDFFIKNLGRTPGIMTEVSYQLIQGSQSQSTWEYAVRDTIVDPVIDGGKDTQPPTPCGLETVYRVRDAKDAMNGVRPFYFYGYVVYVDSFKRRHTYFWRYQNMGIRFVMVHSEERTDKSDL